MRLSTAQTAQVSHPRIPIGVMINVTPIWPPFFCPFLPSISYPTPLIVFRCRIDGSESMSVAHVVASATVSPYRSPTHARLTAIATPTTHLTGRVVWLGHLERQMAFLHS